MTQRRRKKRKKSPARRGEAAQMLRVLWWVLGISLTVLGVTAVGVFGWRAITTSPRLVVNETVVLGAERAGIESIRAYADVQPGASIFDIDLDETILKLRRHPWVKSATVRRRLPDTLVVDVTEQQPAALVALGDLYIVNPDGEPFKRFHPTDQVTLPVITGIAREKATRSVEDVAAIVREGLRHIKTYERYYASKLGRLEELHVNETLGFSFVVQRPFKAMRVHVGRHGTDRLDVAVALVANLKGRQYPKEVWLDNDREQRRIHVKLWGATPEASIVQPLIMAKAR